MNPNIIGLVGMITSLTGMATSTTSQMVNLHREMHPPQAQQQAQVQQHCPPGFKLVVVLKPDGTRELACVQEKP